MPENQFDLGFSCRIRVWKRARDSLTGLKAISKFYERVFLIPAPKGTTGARCLLTEPEEDLAAWSEAQRQHHPVHSGPSPAAPIIVMGSQTGDTAPLRGSLGSAWAAQTPWDVLSCSSCGKTALEEEERPNSHPFRGALTLSSSDTVRSGVSSSHPQQNIN